MQEPHCRNAVGSIQTALQKPGVLPDIAENHTCGNIMILITKESARLHDVICYRIQYTGHKDCLQSQPWDSY